MARYPVELKPDDNGTAMASVPGLHGATFVAGDAKALADAVDQLKAMMATGIADGYAIPDQEPVHGRVTIERAAGGE